MIKKQQKLTLRLRIAYVKAARRLYSRELYHVK